MEATRLITFVLLLAIIVAAGYTFGAAAIDLRIWDVSTNTSQLTTDFHDIREENASSLALRWNHWPLTVYIDSSFVGKNSNYVNDLKSGLQAWEKATNNFVSFAIVDSQDADIRVEWVSSLKEKSTDVLGNTDLKYLTAGGYGLIKSADIQMLTRTASKQLSSVDMTNLAMHEIGHALGLGHSDQESDIMHPVLTVPSSRIKTISSSDINELNDAYDLPVKPDLKIAEAAANKTVIKKFTKTFYLINLTLTIENDGFTDARSPSLSIVAGNEQVKREILSDIDVGSKLNIFFGNIEASGDFNTIIIVLDPDNAISELDENNNVVQLQIE